MALQQPEIEAGEDTQHLNAVYDNIKSYKRRIAELEAALAEETNLRQKAQAENDALRADVQRLQRGEGVVVEIDGKKFTLNSGKADVSEMVTMTNAWVNSAIQPDGTLNSLGNGHTKNRLADSFVL